MNVAQQLSDVLRRMGDDLAYWKERAELAEQRLSVATEALHDIGSRDILGSEIAWRTLDQIEGADEAAGEAMERQRQPENQPLPELTGGP